jgi:murein DD-endopeptidase MepM/ murein hydrolase activator NlpD
LGSTCYIQNYVDADPTSDYHDYTCGFLSYNEHTGTDFRLLNLSMMKEGVNVIASAPGIVRAVRDGMPDISIKKIDSSLIKNRKAGNSVAIRHGKGWETQYSHLRRGSVKVKAGDQIQAGQLLGLVGLSGNTEFPHLHLTVRYQGKVIDPFTGLTAGAGCGQPDSNNLWNKSIIDQLTYQASGIIEAGFSDHVPAIMPLHEHIEKKTALPVSADRIIFWAHVFGVQEGDVQQLVLFDPDGNLLAKGEKIIEKNQARRFTMIGKRPGDGTWQPGDYKAKYTLIRSEKEKTVTVINRSFILNVFFTHSSRDN